MHPNNTPHPAAGKPGQNSKRPFLARILISPDEPRLRAGWRLFIQLFIWQLLTNIFFFGFVILGFEGSYNNFLVNKSISLFAVVVSVYLARRFLDHRSFVSLGLKFNPRAIGDILVGVTIAGLMMLLIFVLELMFGWLEFEGFVWELKTEQSVLYSTLEMFLLFCIVAVDEELLSRGYQLQNLEDGINLPWGVIISSVIFAFMHSKNPNFTIAAWLGLFAAGLFLGMAYVLTRQLWLPIGLHLGWNFFEGTVFGFQVSGLETFRIIEQTVHGPVFITGGFFGPEAGVILIPALVLGIVLVYLYSRSRNTHLSKPKMD
jgi:membrane protease YdiL (CAAX protease family)